jgi:DNA-binding SARP family transcriptional activator
VAVWVAVCGPLTVQRDGRSWSGPELGTRKARLLIAVLTAARGSAVPTDRLAAALWPGQPPRDPEGNLATLVSRLRKAVGDTFVVLRGAS